MPIAAASDIAAFIADSPCAGHEASDCPQLIEMAIGGGVAPTAAEIASTKPWSPLFGAKYTICAAPGAAAPITSMSRLTSTDAPLVSPGSFSAPSTLTALIDGTAICSPPKYASRSLVVNPPPSSMTATVWPAPGVPAGEV